MAEVSKSFHVNGIPEFTELLREMKEDLGPRDAKNILNRAVRQAMKPVLYLAQTFAPVETGALRASLQIEARKPTSKDKRSMYVNPSDVVIGTVTTASGAKLARTKFMNQLAPAGNKIKQVGIASDARANVQEHGSYKMAAHPFLAPALEQGGKDAVELLGLSLQTALYRYQARQAKKG